MDNLHMALYLIRLITRDKTELTSADLVNNLDAATDVGAAITRVVNAVAAGDLVARDVATDALKSQPAPAPAQDKWEGPGEAPHKYSPDYTAQGDCRICGHTWDTHQAPAQDETLQRLSRSARDVLAERQRQITSEGWTTEHDDVHDGAEMAHAAACYTICAAQKDGHKAPPPPAWPWDFSWWKPTDPRRDLVKAGALILAEIERLDRAKAALATVEGR